MTLASQSVARSERIAIGPEVTNGGKVAIEYALPYSADVTIVGIADLLFHRWNVEGVATKARAAKGSKAKKSDDLESYVYRDDAGELAIPGEYSAPGRDSCGEVSAGPALAAQERDGSVQGRRRLSDAARVARGA